MGLGSRRSFDRALRAEISAWVAGYGVRAPVDDVEWAASADVELLSWLDPLVTRARLVYVGESNHFVHEKVGYRIFLSRYLHSRGCRVFVDELAWSDGRRIDRYLATGDRTWLDLVATWGYEGDGRADRDDRSTGYLASATGEYPSTAFRAEHERWLSALRNCTTSDDPVRFWGMDIDYTPGAGYLHLRAALDLFRDVDPSVSAALEGLAARVPGESVADELARLEALGAACTRLVEDRGPRRSGSGPLDDDAWELQQAVRSLRRGHEYLTLTQAATDLPSVAPAMALRERVMAEQVRAVLSRSPEAPVALFAHNLHLARDDTTIDRDGGVGPGGDRAPAVGTQLALEHPGAVASVWMVDVRGRDAQPFREATNLIRSPAGTLNADLGAAGDTYLIPTRHPGGAPSPFDHRRRLWLLYGTSAELRITDQADALYVVRDVTPIRSDGSR
jgi:erythromycin esterase-like protein